MGGANRLEIVLDSGQRIGYNQYKCRRPAGAWRLSNSPPRGQNTERTERCVGGRLTIVSKGSFPQDMLGVTEN